MDPVVLTGEIAPYVTAAIGAYGTAVLTRAEEAAADATVSLGQRILLRITGRGPRPEVEGAVEDLAESPDDEDARAALRMQIKKALREDPELAADIAGLLPLATARNVRIKASGPRSVAAHTIRGNVTTGDGHPN
jgi:hypothetical protein